MTLADAVAASHRRQLGHLSAEQLRHLVALLTAARAPHEADAGPWRGELTPSGPPAPS